MRSTYYVMNNFEDPKSLKITNDLLDTANKTNLKIIIILLPPSEGVLVPVTIGMAGLNILILLKGNIQDHLRVYD